MRKRFRSIVNPQTVAAGSLLGLAGMANATDTVDFSTLTSGIAIAGVVTGILAVAALKVAPAVATYGARKLLAMIGR